MKLYHTFLNSSYIYLTRNNHYNCSPNLVPTNPSGSPHIIDILQ